MKKIFLILCLASIFTACSDHDEDYDFDYIAVEDLTPENIATKLPVVFVEVDAEAFAEMYEEYGEDIELEASISIRRDGVMVLEDAAAEIEIKGGKSASFGLKPLGVKFEDKQSNLNGEIIRPKSKVQDFHSLEKIKALRLRNSGNDFEYSMLKDAAYTALILEAELDLDVMYYEPAQVFVNNEYYGLMNIRTESNSHGIAALYGAKKRDLTMIKLEPGTIELKDGDPQRLSELLRAIEGKDYDALVEAFDISNLIDYFIFETYIGNEDWPHNNVRFFAVDDSKFRFVIFDLDKASNFKINKPPLYFITDIHESPISELFEVLYDNEDFKNQFDNRYKDLLASGKIGIQAFDDIVEQYEERIERDIVYNIDKYHRPGSLLEWYQNVGIILNLFEDREEVVKAVYED